jgi:hypothetical protein
MSRLVELMERGGADSLLVLVPRSIAGKRILLDLLQEQNAVVGLRIITPLQLLDMLVGDFRDKLRLISDSAAAELMRNIAAELKSDHVGNALPELIGRRGGGKAAFATIRELTLADYGPDDLERTQDPKLMFLAQVWRRYNPVLDSHRAPLRLMDTAGRIIHAFESVESGSAHLPEISRILVTQFASIPYHYRRLLKALSRTIEIHSELPFDESREELFLDVALFHKTMDSKTRIVYQPASDHPVLGQVQRRLFSNDRIQVTAAKDCIRICKVPGRYDEVEAAGMRILELIDSGISPARIGLTVRDLGMYDQFIRSVFRRFRIP